MVTLRCLLGVTVPRIRLLSFIKKKQKQKKKQRKLRFKEILQLGQSPPVHRKECIIQNLVCLITELLGPLGLYVLSFHRFSGGWLIFSAERFAQLYYWISSSNFSRENFFLVSPPIRKSDSPDNQSRLCLLHSTNIDLWPAGLPDTWWSAWEAEGMDRAELRRFTAVNENIHVLHGDKTGEKVQSPKL